MQKDASFDIANITAPECDQIFYSSVQQFAYFTYVIGADDSDLSSFRDAGGLADELIPPNGTSDYYARVEHMDPDVRDCYRFFEAPGVGHCGGGNGPVPGNALEALVKWVEEGEGPGYAGGNAG